VHGEWKLRFQRFVLAVLIGVGHSKPSELKMFEGRSIGNGLKENANFPTSKFDLAISVPKFKP